MVALSFFEEVKDKASRIIPTPYMDVVEEATQPQFVRPMYDNVVVLCDRAESNAECAVDIVRAIRRRIRDNDPKVQFLVVDLLAGMIKVSGLMLHAEIASQKGLLRDLQAIATRHPCITHAERLAREAALTLILNLSVWFAAHPDGRLYVLTTIADDVRLEVGADAFHGINPDKNTKITFYGKNSRRSQPSSNVRPRRPNPKESQGPVVDAIGVCFPKENELAAMLDACVTLAEYINNVKVNSDGSIPLDDVIEGFRAKIREDHKLVTVLLSSDLKLDNRDTLRDILESQSSILRQLDNEGRIVPQSSNVDPVTQRPSACSGTAITEDRSPPAAMDTENQQSLTSTDALEKKLPESLLGSTALPQEEHQRQENEGKSDDVSSREVNKDAEAVIDAAAENVMDVFHGLSAPSVALCEPSEKDCEVIPTNTAQGEQEPVQEVEERCEQPSPHDNKNDSDVNREGLSNPRKEETQEKKSESVEEGIPAATQDENEDEEFDAFIESKLAN